MVFFTVSLGIARFNLEGEFAGSSSAAGKIEMCLDCFPLRMSGYRLFGDGLVTLPRLMGNSNCLSRFPAFSC